MVAHFSLSDWFPPSGFQRQHPGHGLVGPGGPQAPGLHLQLGNLHLKGQRGSEGLGRAPAGGNSPSSASAPLAVLGSGSSVCGSPAGASLRVPAGGLVDPSTLGSACRRAASPSARWALAGIWRPGRPAVPGGRPGTRPADGPITTEGRAFRRDLLTSSGRSRSSLVAAPAGGSIWVLGKLRPSSAGGWGDVGDISAGPEDSRVRAQVSTTHRVDGARGGAGPLWTPSSQSSAVMAAWFPAVSGSRSSWETPDWKVKVQINL